MPNDIHIDDLANPIYSQAQLSALEYAQTLKVELNRQSILAEAESKTGLSDWGPDDFLPRLDWRNEVQIFQRDIEARRQAMEIGDIKAVGFITRNAVSSVLIRLDSLFRQIEAAEGPEPPPL